MLHTTDTDPSGVPVEHPLDGCFIVDPRREVDHQVVTLIGVVLGQNGANLIAAGLSAARQLTDRVAPAPAR